MCKVRNQVQSVHISNHTTLKNLATYSGVAKNFTYNRAKSKVHTLRHTSSVNLLLNFANKLERLHLALSSVEYMSHRTYHKFKGIYNQVHIGGKWFDVMKVKEVYYLSSDEELTQGITKNKTFIAKALVLCALARPRYNYNKYKIFDEKIGVWPFVTKEKAKRDSRICPAGLMETKPIVINWMFILII